jgi:hypothetical protein
MGIAVERPTSVLVVSAWHQGEPPVLTARITQTVDVTQPDRVTEAAVGLEAIEGIIRRWLEQVESRRHD